MNMDRCKEHRDALHAYRAGELSPLARQRVDAHLSGCEGCRAELWLQAGIEDAAKAGPAPLDDAKKRRLLARIHEEVRAEEAPAPARTWAWRLWPAFAFAAAAALALFVWRPSVEVEPASGWVASAAGVRAFAAEPARVGFEPSERAAVLRLDAGALDLHFDRPAGAEPLRVTTPHAELIVRGTTFRVDVRASETLLSVLEGTVELRAAGRSQLVGPGGTARATVAALERVEAEPAALAALVSTFPEYAPQPAAAPSAAPAVSAPAPRPAPAAPAPPSVEAPVDAALAPDAAALRLAAARRLWLDGDAAGAEAEARALLALPELRDELRREALYLTATVQRSAGRAAEAAAAFATLAADSGAPQARLARLERARLLAGPLGRHALALEELAALDGDDSLAETALLERCSLLIEDAALAEARVCLDAHVTRFPAGARSAQVKRLLERLPPAR
jgi:hypothetical protein